MRKSFKKTRDFRVRVQKKTPTKRKLKKMKGNQTDQPYLRGACNKILAKSSKKSPEIKQSKR